MRFMLGMAMAAGLAASAFAEDAVSTQSNVPATPDNAKPAAPDTLKVHWKNGLRFDTADKELHLRIGGRIHCDWAWISEDKDVKAAIEEFVEADQRPAKDLKAFLERGSFCVGIELSASRTRLAREYHAEDVRSGRIRARGA